MSRTLPSFAPYSMGHCGVGLLLAAATCGVSGCTTRGMAVANPVKRHTMLNRSLPSELVDEVSTAMPEWFVDQDTARRALNGAKIYHTSWWRPANNVFAWVWLDEVHVRPNWEWRIDEVPQMHLLVHELAHVIQHTRDGSDKMIRDGLSNAGRRIAGMPNWHDTPFEFEAERVAKEAMDRIDMDRMRALVGSR